MQMIQTCYRLLSKTATSGMVWRQKLVVSIILCAIYSKGAEELCFVSVAMRNTNLVYYVAEPKGGTDILGVAQYLDRCVSYASTNVCVHIRVGLDVLFAHVAPLLNMCLTRNLNRVLFHWPDGGKDADNMPHFSFQYVSLYRNASTIRMFPYLDEETNKVLKTNGIGIHP